MPSGTIHDVVAKMDTLSAYELSQLASALHQYIHDNDKNNFNYHTNNNLQELLIGNLNNLENTNDNRITLITCVENKPNKRLCIPELPEEYFVEAVKAIVKIDEEWIPTQPGTSLYIRPFIIATDESIACG